MSYAQNKFSSGSVSTNELQVQPRNQQEITDAKDSVWYDLYLNPTLQFQQSDLNRRIFIANSTPASVSGSTYALTLPPAQTSQGCSLKLRFVQAQQAPSAFGQTIRSSDNAPMIGGLVSLQQGGFDNAFLNQTPVTASNGTTSSAVTVFDGQRYMYMGGQNLVQYDTTSSFTSSSSYLSYSAVTGNVYSMCYDGSRYLYVLGSTQCAKYDTTLSFTQSSSYTVYTLTGSMYGHTYIPDSVYDGRYVYFFRSGLIMRIDTQGSFTDPGSYTTYTSSDNNRHAVYDGQQYIYVSVINGSITLSRFDKAYFTTSSARQTVSIYPSPPSPQVLYTSGVLAFDGKYIYIEGRALLKNSVLIRYDPATSFTDTASYYTMFNVGSLTLSTTINYILFYNNCIYMTSSGSGNVVVYDTTLNFLSASSYGAQSTGLSSSNSILVQCDNNGHVYFVSASNTTLSQLASYVSGGTGYTMQLTSPDFQTHTALSFATGGVQQGGILDFFSTGSAWEVSGVVTTYAAPQFTT